MKHLGRVMAIVLLAVNACFTAMLLFSAYSPAVQPVVHPVRSCLGLAFPVFGVINACFLVFWLLVGRWRMALLPLAGFVCCFQTLRLYCPLNLPSGDVPEGSVKLLSYNVMGFANGQLVDGRNPVLDYLASCGADILCLQEYRTDFGRGRLSQKDVDRALKDYPYRNVMRVGKARSSRLACFSKYPILSARLVDYDSRYNGSVLYELQVERDTFTLINNHLESNKLTRADKEAYQDMLDDPRADNVKHGARTLLRKLAEASAIRAPQADAVAREVEASPHRHVIVCGDFNDSPVSYAHRTIARSLNDAFVSSGCGLGISYNRNKFYFRIDHILLDKSLKAYRCVVDRSIRSSDHYPVWCCFGKRE